MKRRMDAKRVLGVVLVLTAVTGGCGDRDAKLTQLPAAEGKAATSDVLMVSAATVTRQAIVRSVVANGTTEPARDAATSVRR